MNWVGALEASGGVDAPTSSWWRWSCSRLLFCIKSAS